MSAEAVAGLAARPSTCQPGIVTRQQSCLALGAFDLQTGDAARLRELLAAWTAAAARVSAGRRDPQAVEDRVDSGEVQELEPARLTVTLGLGPSVFARVGLEDRRPVAARALPAFAGDELDPRRCDGDLCVQACADDPQVAFHALRTLARVARGTARMRWAQPGFISLGTVEGKGRTPRNLFGFREGARNIREPRELELAVWVAGRDREWMLGGTYMIVRRLRMRLPEWDALAVTEQEAVIGREKVSGATFDDERWAVRGVRPVPEDSHIALAGDVRMLRRSYNYFDGVDAASGEPDAGLVLICFVRDPRRQFVPLQQRLSERDPLGRYAVCTGSAQFAIPPAPAAGEFVGERLFY
jgi:deferrochelatase/peroxidase EfeB